MIAILESPDLHSTSLSSYSPSPDTLLIAEHFLMNNPSVSLDIQTIRHDGPLVA